MTAFPLVKSSRSYRCHVLSRAPLLQVKSVKFKSGISAVLATRRVMVVTFPGKLAVFDAGTLEDRFSVTTCYPAPGLVDNPVALGHRWLAYGEKRLTGYLQSRGGMSAEASHSYTASVLHAAKSISKGGERERG